MTKDTIEESMVKDAFKEALSLLGQDKRTEAKALLESLSRWLEDPRSLGICHALRGLVHANNGKNLELLDPARRSSLKEALRVRQASIWSDDFDRGFFEAWGMALEVFESRKDGEALSI